MTKPSGAKRHYDMPLPAKQQRGRQAFGGPARAGRHPSPNRHAATRAASAVRLQAQVT